MGRTAAGESERAFLGESPNLIFVVRNRRLFWLLLLPLLTLLMDCWERGLFEHGWGEIGSGHHPDVDEVMSKDWYGVEGCGNSNGEKNGLKGSEVGLRRHSSMAQSGKRDGDLVRIEKKEKV